MARLEVFLLLSWVWRTDSLCSPNIFFKNCWIRRFPGLTIDLEYSQRRGAHVLNFYTESTAQQCSRTCCLLKNVSCNLAVFYYDETNHWNLNCLHVYCPALESCILKPTLNVVLYNITAGRDPDLLVFEKLSFKDKNARSSFNKWERHGSARLANSEKYRSATTSSRYLPREISSFTAVQELAMNSTGTSPADQTASTSYSEATAALRKGHFTDATDIISKRNSSTTISDNETTFPTSGLTSFERLSHAPSPAHLNNSKHLNETKVYSGMNYTSDDQGQIAAWEGMEGGSWLLPVGLCSSLTILCCCTVFLVRGCQRKRGRYRPVVPNRGASIPRSLSQYIG